MVRIAGSHPAGQGTIPGNEIILLSYRYRVIQIQSHKERVTESKLPQIQSHKETESQRHSHRGRVADKESKRNRVTESELQIQSHKETE